MLVVHYHKKKTQRTHLQAHVCLVFGTDSVYLVRGNLAIIVGQAETLKGAWEQVRVGTVGSVGSNLLVVKERDETDVGVVGQRVGVLQTSDQSLETRVMRRKF